MIVLKAKKSFVIDGAAIKPGEEVTLEDEIVEDLEKRYGPEYFDRVSQHSGKPGDDADDEEDEEDEDEKPKKKKGKGK